MKLNFLINAKKISKFSTPIVLASASSLVTSLFSTRFLGIEKENNLYLLALFLPISYVLIGICETIRIVAFSYAGVPSRNLILDMVSLILLASSIFLIPMIIFVIFKNQIITILKVKQAFRENFLQFSFWMLLVGFVMGLSSALTSSLVIMRKIYTAMFISMLASLFVVLLTYSIAYRMKLGLEGYAFSIFLAYLFSGFLSIYLLKFNGVLINKVRYISTGSLLNQLKFAMRVIVPVGSSYMLIFLSLFILTEILANFDKPLISGFGVAYRIQALILLPAIALGTAMALMKDEKAIIPSGLIFSILIYFFIGVIVYNFRVSLSNFVAQDPIVSKNSAIYLKFVSISYIGSGPLLSYLTFLEQTGSAFISLLVNFSYFSVVLVFGGSLCLFFHHYQILYGSILVTNIAAFLLVLAIIIKEYIYA